MVTFFVLSVRSFCVIVICKQKQTEVFEIDAGLRSLLVETNTSLSITTQAITAEVTDNNHGCITPELQPANDGSRHVYCIIVTSHHRALHEKQRQQQQLLGYNLHLTKWSWPANASPSVWACTLPLCSRDTSTRGKTDKTTNSFQEKTHWAFQGKKMCSKQLVWKVHHTALMVSFTIFISTIQVSQFEYLFNTLTARLYFWILLNLVTKSLEAQRSVSCKQTLTCKQ